MHRVLINTRRDENCKMESVPLDITLSPFQTEVMPLCGSIFGIICNMQKASVVMSVNNAEARLRPCLGSVANQASSTTGIACSDDGSPVRIAFICDGGYVIPTAVAIRSIAATVNGRRMVEVRVVYTGDSAEDERKLVSAGQGRVSVSVVKMALGNLANLHKYQDGAICVATDAALLKFRLPEMLSDWDKVLYLDGDLIARDDVAQLYDTDISGVYAAVVAESGAMYWYAQYMMRYNRYFNSGVMLLNLERLRRENVSQVLIKAKEESTDSSLMDQNAFNEVFEGKVIHLPIRWNFSLSSLDRAGDKWSVSDISRLYGVDYETKRDVFADAAIVHFSSKDKPWKSPDNAGVALWREYDGEPVPEPEEPFAVSVVIPCYNLEKYIERTLDSIFVQTLRNIEIICLDDGSTDRTLAILKRLAETHGSMRVVANENRRQGYERNQGVRLARGRYVYFMDGDDILEPHALEFLYSRAEKNDLDLVLFEGDTIYETPDLERRFPEFANRYHRKNFYPKVYNGQDLYAKLRVRRDLIVSPCLQFASRDLLMSMDELFPEDMPMWEDCLYTVRVMLAAKRVACFVDELFLRLVRDDSTMTKHSDNETRLDVVKTLIERLSDIASTFPEQSETRKWVRQHALSFVNEAERLRHADQALERSRKKDFKKICRMADVFRLDLVGCKFGNMPKWISVLCPGVIMRAVQCYKDNGLVYTLRRVLFGRQY